MDDLRLAGRLLMSGDGVSRRMALRLGGGGIAALVAAGALTSGAAAQEATAMASPGAMPSVVQTWLDAWNSADPATSIAALYAADGVYEDVPTNTSGQGAGIQGYLTAALKSFGTIKVTPKNAFAAGDWAAAEYIFAAVDHGIVPGAPATGKPFAVRTVTIFELAGDKIRRSSDYYDVATILAQVGLLPAGGTPAAATPS